MKSININNLKLFFISFFSTFLIKNILIIILLLLFLFRKNIIYVYISILIPFVWLIILLFLLIFHREFLQRLEKILKFARIIGEKNKRILLSFINDLNPLVKDLYIIDREGEKIFDHLEIIKKAFLNSVDFSKVDNFISYSNFKNITQNVKKYLSETLNFIKIILDSNNQCLIELTHKQMEMEKSFITILFSIEILKEWHNIIESSFDKELKDLVNKINNIESINQEEHNLINEAISNFVEQCKKSKFFLLKEREGLNTFFSNLDSIESNFVKYIEKYYGEFKRISDIVQNIEKISSDIKIISINLSIEASKTQNNKAFSVISKELQKLSFNAEKIVKQILSEIHILLNDVKEEKKVVDLELENLYKIIENSKTITLEYDESIKRINFLLDSLINDIKENNIKNKELIFELFKDFQKIVIAKEEVNHKDMFITKILENISKSLEETFTKKGVAFESMGNEIKESKKKILEEIRSLITTRNEKEFFKRLYMQVIGEEYKEEDIKESDKDIILF